MKDLSKSLPRLILFTLLINAATWTVGYSQGQGSRRSIPKDNKPHLVAGLTYLSDNVYLGRRDSVALPYLSPSLGFHDKSGLFINGSLSYSMAQGNTRLDMVSFEGGWAYNSENWNVELSASKEFYSGESYSVKSEIGGNLSGYFSHDFGPVEPSLDLGADLGTSFDFGIGLGLEHSFSIIENRLELSPSAKVNASTQNFYSNYYNKRRYSPKRKNNSGSSTSAEIINAGNFQIMDYELSGPIEYTYKKKLKVNFTPTYAIPVHPANIITTNKSGGNTSSAVSKENLTNVFYFSLGITYTW